MAARKFRVGQFGTRTYKDGRVEVVEWDGNKWQSKKTYDNPLQSRNKMQASRYISAADRMREDLYKHGTSEKNRADIRRRFEKTVDPTQAKRQSIGELLAATRIPGSAQEVQKVRDAGMEDEVKRGILFGYSRNEIMDAGSVEQARRNRAERGRRNAAMSQLTARSLLGPQYDQNIDLTDQRLIYENIFSADDPMKAFRLAKAQANFLTPTYGRNYNANFQGIPDQRETLFGVEQSPYINDYFKYDPDVDAETQRGRLALMGLGPDGQRYPITTFLAQESGAFGGGQNVTSQQRARQAARLANLGIDPYTMTPFTEENYQSMPESGLDPYSVEGISSYYGLQGNQYMPTYHDLFSSLGSPFPEGIPTTMYSEVPTPTEATYIDNPNFIDPRLLAEGGAVETITMPEGGLGSFFTSNIDEVGDNVLMFGREGGINSMKEVADRMARMGREGDTFVVHASEKEVMVPSEVAEKNPELVGQIKQAIAAEGADPEAYVVGSDRNSINPYTGQREFFLKKLVKGIKKVFKKAAKIILPVAINFFAPGLGTIASAAIGAGIGGLIQGESLGQAFKSAALGGLTAGVASGISGAISNEGFMTGLKGGLPASYSGSGLKGALPSASDFALRKSGDPMFMGTGFKGTQGYTDLVTKQAADAALAAKPFDLKAEYLKNVEAGIPSTEAMTLAESASKTATAAAAAAKPSMMSTALKFGLPALGIASATGMFDPIPASEIDLTDVAGSDLSGTLADATDMVEENPEKFRVGQPTGRPEYVDAAFTITDSGLTSGEYLPSQGTYVPPATPSGVYASLVPSGAGTVNQDTGTMVPSGDGQFATYVPPAAPVKIPGYNPTVTGMRPAPLYGVDAQGNPVLSPYRDVIMPAQFVGSNQEVQMAAAGGPMTMSREGQRNMALEDFPRRTGQIQGPGTETSDDIPAMLSDGEFVMTARAVRGAGNGSREQGFKKMYDIMRAFEGGAVA